jgi:hypothetical protein
VDRLIEGGGVVMTVAGCQSCGTVVESPMPGGFYGQPAGECPGCGRLMLWMTPQDGWELRREAPTSGRLSAAVKRAREARPALTRRGGPSAG